jgi:uncharacterized protein YfaS (alpha-2-macroglobulin family)
MSYTSGEYLSVMAHLRISLRNAFSDTIKPGAETGMELISLKPAVSGKTYWINGRTFEFIPDKPLNHNTIYTVKVDLSKVTDVPDELKTMEYQIKTMEQSFSFSGGQLTTYPDEMRYFKYEGTIRTADAVIENANLENAVAISFSGEKMNPKWDHSVDGRVHKFTVDSIRRLENGEKLKISIHGEKIGVDEDTEEMEIRIPGINEFEVLSVEPVTGDISAARITFSDPLLKDQDLRGLIYTDNYKPTVSIDGNIAKLDFGRKLRGNKTIHISAGIKNALGYKLDKSVDFEISFIDAKPSVKIIGKGVIMPSSDGLIVPVEAVNLSALDLRVIQIYENNVLFFLQENNPDGESGIKRVGRLILQKKIPLKQNIANPGIPHIFKIDLAKYIDPQPGAIYRIELRFRKEYSLYNCSDNNQRQALSDVEYREEIEKEMTKYDGQKSYYWYDYYPDGYRWSEKDNPCHVSYYYGERFPAKNIIVSNLGITAQGTNTGKYMVAVSNLKTAEPVSGAKVEFFNFQRRLIFKAKTDGNGIIISRLESKPFFVVVTNGDEKGYLRLKNNQALSFSNFNTGGMVAKKGMKGFIYGERGVWRPGDDIHLTFILEDKDNRLPGDYPIKFEFYNPLNQLIESRVVNSGENGFYPFHTKTDADAVTGNWLVKVKAGGAVFSKTVKIETIKPNRLKGGIKFDKSLITKDDLSKAFTFESKWLHGSPATDLDFDIKVKLKKTKTGFKNFSQYNFDNAASKFVSSKEDIISGRLDKNGRKDIVINLPSSNAPGFLNAVFTSRVFEKSGDFSILTQNVKYSPYDGYVGARLVSKGDDGWYLINKKHKLSVVSLTPGGKINPNRKVNVKIYKLQWRWWWNSNNNNIAYYFSSSSATEVLNTDAVTGETGKLVLDFKLPYNDYHDNGRYLIMVTDKKSGHISSFPAYFSKWYGSIGETGEAATILSFKTGKKEYNVGEEATVIIPTSKDGMALVSIQKGSDILDAFWVKTTDNETRFTFPVKHNMAPNIYVHISLIQPHANTINDNPIRMYGVVPVDVNDPQTRLEPVITTAAQYEPEKEFSIKVNEKNGRDMTYTIAVVDEGLLDITGFRTPDPYSYFYSREALTNRTWDMYDYVIGAYGARLENAFAIGGGDAVIDPSKNKANRFKPVVLFDGPFFLKGGKTKTHTFRMPNYVGSVKVMVVAGQDGAYGNAEKAVPVKKDLMILGTLPRVLGPRESVTLPVTVFAMSNKVKKVKISVTTNSLLKTGKTKAKTLTFSGKGEKIANFPLKVNDLTGKAKVHIVATCGNLKSTYDVELDIRNPNPEYSIIKDTIIEKGMKWSTTIKPFGLPGSNYAVVEISSVPPVNLNDRLHYLVHYPYGCIEQTTSSVFPQLFLNDLIDITPSKSIEIQENITAGLERLRGFQLSDGSFSYWPGEDFTNLWGTNYAGHFLLAAKAKGYALPQGMLQKWLRYQKRKANRWTYAASGGNTLNQAYRLYLLAVAGKPQTGAMNRLREDKHLSERAKNMLAAAFAVSGRRVAAVKLIESPAAGSSRKLNSYDYSYGSPYRDKALKLITLTEAGFNKKAFMILRDIAGKLSSDDWMSTQTTAMCLLAVSKYFTNNNITGSPKAEMVFGNKTIDVSTPKNFYTQDFKLKSGSPVPVKIKNKSKGIIYVRVITRGKPSEGKEIAKSDNLTLKIRYTDMEGKSIDPSVLKQGTDFKAVVTVTNPYGYKDYHNMALSQIFPSGWEILNDRLFDIGNGGNSTAAYVDFRDDRIYTFFSLKKHQSKTFTVLLNAAYSGTYYMPAVKCGEMYDNSIEAVVAGKWVKVVR